MKAYKINPENREITEVEYDGNYKQIYQIIGNGCTCFTTVRINKEYDVIYLDDESLIKTGRVFKSFMVPHANNGYLFGVGLVLGTDSEGEATSPSISLEKLKKMVVWTNLTAFAP